jgi:small-conductance mechanosensitive channel
VTDEWWRRFQIGSRVAFAGGIVSSVAAAWLGNDRSSRYSADSCVPTPGNHSLFVQVWIWTVVAIVLAVTGFVLLTRTAPSSSAITVATVLIILTLVACVGGILVGSSAFCFTS